MSIERPTRARAALHALLVVAGYSLWFSWLVTRSRTAAARHLHVLRDGIVRGRHHPGLADGPVLHLDVAG